ncbi:AAA family ATPase [Pseudomonas sp. NFX98]|uniref:AAA family ATPase n=1 Tax=Pseudomonas sp. NFX98 TaxID=3399122 RepID=UPI0039FD231C
MNKTAIHNHGEPLSVVVSRMKGVKQHGDSFMAVCPAHQDKSPSLSLSRAGDGRALVHCFAGCDPRDVLGAVGLEMRDLFPENMSQDQRREFRRIKLEHERDSERLIIEIAKSEAEAGALSEESTARLAFAHERVDQLDRQLVALGNAATPPRLVLLEVKLDDVMNASPDAVRYAVTPLMPRRHVTLFGGHGGIGKSSLALVICAHVACGLPFAGLEVEQSPVLFVSLEDEASLVRLRLRSIIEEYGLPAERVLASFRLLDGTQTITALMTEGDGFSAQPVFTQAYRELEAGSHGAGLIVIDNASDAFDANENSRRMVRAFVRGLADIARKHNAAVVLLAHIDKSAAKDGARGNNYSGSTAWHNSARSRLALMEKDGRILLVHEKANLSVRAEPMAFLFVDGVPVPEAGSQGNGLTTESFDQAEIIRVFTAANDAGIKVPATVTPGAHSAMKALQSLPEYSRMFRGKAGDQRAAHAITALIRTGHVRRIKYKTPQRKIRELFELVELPETPAVPLENVPILSV